MEQLFFLRARETEELQAVVADVRVAAKLRAATLRRKPAHRLQREVHQIPDALHVEDHDVAALLDYHPRQPPDHFANLRASAARPSPRRAPGAAASSATPRACPSTSADLAFLAWKTSSTATSSGRWRSSSRASPSCSAQRRSSMAPAPATSRTPWARWRTQAPPASSTTPNPQYLEPGSIPRTLTRPATLSRPSPRRKSRSWRGRAARRRCPRGSRPA